jgi:hypothetical protein
LRVEGTGDGVDYAALDTGLPHESLIQLDLDPDVARGGKPAPTPRREPVAGSAIRIVSPNQEAAYLEKTLQIRRQPTFTSSARIVQQSDLRTPHGAVQLGGETVDAQLNASTSTPGGAFNEPECGSPPGHVIGRNPLGTLGRSERRVSGHPSAERHLRDDARMMRAPVEIGDEPRVASKNLRAIESSGKRACE